MSTPRNDITFTAIFHGAERLNNSTNGNPRWRLLTSEGSFNTDSDASVGYEVANFLHSKYGVVGKLVTFTATKRGKYVWKMEAAS